MLLRPLAPPDLDAALEILREVVSGSPHGEELGAVLHRAAMAPSDEARGIVGVQGDAVVGVVVYGEFAGASGASRVHLVAIAEPVRGVGIGTALMARAIEELRSRGARLVLAEVPDDPEVLGDYWAFLAACGFREEARVPDHVRDGVALAFLRRDLGAPGTAAGHGASRAEG